MINLVMLSPAHVHSKGCIESIAKRTDCKLVAIWDDVADRGQRYAESCGAKFVADLNAAVNFPGVDGFVLFAENTRHLPLLRAAIPAGKPIFCEKPFATTVAEVAEAMQLVRKHGTIVHMGYTQPFQANIRGAAKLIADGALGKVTHVRCRNSHNAAYGRWFDSPDVAWFTDPALAGGGAFMDMGTHAVHVLRSLFGPVTKVLARIDNVSGVYPKTDDTGIALLQFAGGQLGMVEASWVQTGGIGGLEFTGSLGTIYNDPKLGGLALAVPDKEPKLVPPADARPCLVARLVAAITGELSRAELDADLAAAADAVAIMEACYQSNRTNAWVDVAKV
jgi:predicted dehydrogenase